MTPCQWCHALVATDSTDAHALWHRTNNLHAGDCAELLAVLEQRAAEGWYIQPQPCSCGLAEVPLPEGDDDE